MAKSKKKTSNSKSKNNNKENAKKIETVGSFSVDIWSKIFLVFGVIAFFLAFYLLTLYITNKNSGVTTPTDEVEVEANISYEEIILGRSLSMGDGEYYVICYDGSNDEIKADYSGVVSTYRAKEGHLPIYYVNMGSVFNKSFATTEESNKAPNSVDDFAINGPTLMKIRDHKVVDYFEGLDNIKNQLS